MSDKPVPPSVAEFTLQERQQLLATIERLKEAYAAELNMLAGRNYNFRMELAALKAEPSGVVLPERFEMEPYQTVDKGSSNYKAGFNAAIKQIRESLNSPPVSVVETFQCEHASCQSLGEHHPFCGYVKQNSGFVEFERYDAGLLNDFGGGNVDWWQDYIRAELDRAHDFYQSQQPVSATDDPVAIVEYTGYEPANSLKWLNKGLAYMEPGTKLYARSALTAPAPNHSEQVRHMVREGWQLVPVELLNIAALHLENSGYTETGKKIRQLLAKSEGVKP